MAQIKIGNVIYGSTFASDITYKNTTVEKQLDLMPIFDVTDNTNVENDRNDYLTYANILDSLNSSDTDKALSANQGRILNEKFDNIDFSELENDIEGLTATVNTLKNINKLTQAEYDALPEYEKNTGIYVITDVEGLTAKTLEYDDSKTGLCVNNVQDAIDEQNKNLIKNNIGGAIIISTTHNSLDNAYVFEEDGYLTIYSPTANAGDYITGYLCSSTTSHKIYLIAQCMKAGYPNVKTVYVKKGMRFYHDSATGEVHVRYLQ